MLHKCPNHDKPIMWEAYEYETECPACNDKELTEKIEELEAERDEEQIDGQTHFDNLVKLDVEIRKLASSLTDYDYQKETHPQIAGRLLEALKVTE